MYRRLYKVTFTSPIMQLVFSKKNFAKPFFKFVIRRVRENFLKKMNVLAIKGQVFYYINADK